MLQPHVEDEIHEEVLRFHAEHGIPSSQVVRVLLDSLKGDKFYTIVDNTDGYRYEVKKRISERAAGQVSGDGVLGPDFVNDEMKQYIGDRLMSKSKKARVEK
eukprot:gnl/TRDRNA2_/TRDRNA2_173779_c1_seq1.p1 gnl/TRDRNA2_/TRDRNA2_173779_c1~~gnl/TRDRNA2_/TRDRNA2_173779_c1_seq1.p1  ORF type:complete len:102 (+),score=20.34 gnl/TRDRNA2_/TRDRNA2_173779_c1_seq1:113-418(+)